MAMMYENFIVIAPDNIGLAIGDLIETTKQITLGSNRFLKYGIVIDLHEANKLPVYDIIGLTSIARACLALQSLKPSSSKINIDIFNNHPSADIAGINYDHGGVNNPFADVAGINYHIAGLTNKLTFALEQAMEAKGFKKERE
jgi:hypothetical protein